LFAERLTITRRLCGVILASDLPRRSDMARSVLLGRLLAVMCHPFLAWTRLPRAGRVVLAAGYAGLAYLGALLTLLALRR
jgi:hypothetical protein